MSNTAPSIEAIRRDDGDVARQRAAAARPAPVSVAAGANDRIPRIFLGAADVAVLVLAFVAAKSFAPVMHLALLPGGLLYPLLPGIFPIPAAPTPTEQFPAFSESIWLLVATAPATLVVMELAGGYRRLLGQSRRAPGDDGHPVTSRRHQLRLVDRRRAEAVQLEPRRDLHLRSAVGTRPDCLPRHDLDLSASPREEGRLREKRAAGRAAALGRMDGAPLPAERAGHAIPSGRVAQRPRRSSSYAGTAQGRQGPRHPARAARARRGSRRAARPPPGARNHRHPVVGRSRLAAAGDRSLRLLPDPPAYRSRDAAGQASGRPASSRSATIRSGCPKWCSRRATSTETCSSSSA